MTRFRPCIDLHEGRVKQIVGGSLRDEGPGPQTHFIAEQGPAHFAARYRDDDLGGGHVIRLGQGNDGAAREALEAWPGGLQLGGGIRPDNAEAWLDVGAAKVIVTSWLFEGAKLSLSRARELSDRVGRERLVIDLSCVRRDDEWYVAADRWQTQTQTPVNAETLVQLAEYCSEFLIHSVDVEGLGQGIDEKLVRRLGAATPLACTYAGGGREIQDLGRVERLSEGRVDLTFGSALDLFGGDGVRYVDCVAWNRDLSD